VINSVSKSPVQMMEAELPEEKIEQSLVFFNTLGDVAKAGFRCALASCGCHICQEVLWRIRDGDLR